GAPDDGDFARADAIAAALPAPLRALAGSRAGAMPLVLALLRESDPRLAERQDIEIAARLGAAVANETRRIHVDGLAGLHPQLRLPLASLAFPVLRLRPRPEIDAFLDVVHAAIHVDAR